MCLKIDFMVQGEYAKHIQSGILTKVLVVLLVSFSCFLGCDGFETTHSPVEDAAVLSISDNRPADVMIGAFLWHSNTCVNPEAEVFADVIGATIHLTGKMDACSMGCICGDAVTETYGEVKVKNLEVGEYSIESPKGNVLTRLLIQSDTAYVLPVSGEGSNYFFDIPAVETLPV